MYASRTRFKKEIVAEFLPPLRKTKKQKVIVFCDGAPSVPDKARIMEFFSKKGYWTFFPRYRGAWESDGLFLQHSLEKDVLDILDELPKGFADLWSGKKFKIKTDEIIVYGGSFGGPAALLASKDSRINKVVCISPVIDWTKPGKDEPLGKMQKFFAEGFGNGYRVTKNGWDKLKSGNFYNPIRHVEELDGSKILLIHAKDDTVCPYRSTKEFATKTKSTLITLPRGGHLSSSILMTPRHYNIFKKFIKN